MESESEREREREKIPPRPLRAPVKLGSGLLPRSKRARRGEVAGLEVFNPKPKTQNPKPRCIGPHLPCLPRLPSPIWRPRPELNWDHTFRKRVLYPFELRGPRDARKLVSRRRQGHKKMQVDNPLPRGSLTDPLSNEHDRNERAHPYARGDSVHHDTRDVPLYHGHWQDLAP